MGLLGTGAETIAAALGCVVWEDGKRWIEKHEIYNCNWLQPMENSVDPSHLFWLHGDTAHLVGTTVDHYEEEHNFIPFEYGIINSGVLRAKSPVKVPGSINIRWFFRSRCGMFSAP